MAESNCSYNMQEVTAIGVVLGITTVISCLSCLFALFLVILFQKYRSSTQRVIVYLTVSVLVYSVVEFLQAATVNVQESVTKYCAVMGFLDQYVAWMILMAITCITTDLFVKVFFKWETTKRMEIFMCQPYICLRSFTRGFHLQLMPMAELVPSAGSNTLKIMLIVRSTYLVRSCSLSFTGYHFTLSEPSS